MPIETLGYDHVDLTVNDLVRSCEFYDRVLHELGFRRTETWDGGVVYEGAGGVSLALLQAHEHARGAQFDRYRVGLHHLAFRAKCREDVDTFHRFLLAATVEVLDPPAEYPQYGAGYYAVFFADPDAIKLECVHYPR